MTETAEQSPAVTAASRYANLQPDRDHFLQRGDECAKLTLPMLFQKDATAARNMKIRDPEQSLGTRGVNAMAAKMSVSLFPINTPFFKMNIDDVGLPATVDEEKKEQVKKGLSKLERQTLKDIENSGDVTTFNEALKHLLVVGNVGLHVADKATRLYNLNKYVVMRDPDGTLREAVICEEVAVESLDKDFVNKLMEIGKGVNNGKTEKTLKLYTWIKFTDDKVEWHQEVEGMKVPDSDSEVPADGNPWLFLRFTPVDGEDYGRAHVEMYLGDLKSLEVLQKAVNDAAKAAAKVIFLVRPNGTTKAKVLADAPNLAVRSGDANDVTVLRLDKSADMQVALKMIEEISQRLAHAFMLRSEVMRDAERVTAEEVRIVARELDEANGGIYSILSRELQLPYVKRRLFLMRRKSRVGKLPDGVEIAIVTGFAALGRGHDGDKLMRFLEKVGTVLKNPELGQFVNIDELVSRLAVADGIDTEGLFPTKEEREAAQQQQQGTEMASKVAPELVKQMGGMMQQQQKGIPDGASPEAGA